MQATMDISPDILKWIASNADLTQAAADTLDVWINGTKKPTFNQIEQMSRNTGMPLAYFFLKDPPKENIALVEYRTIDSAELTKPSRDLINTIHDMEEIQYWMREHLVSEGYSPLDYVGKFSHETDHMRFAGSVRELLNIDDSWTMTLRSSDKAFNRLKNAISTKGTIVMMSGIVGSNTHRSLNIDEFRAFSFVDKYAPLIFINSNDSVSGRLFSLLHEFAHICIGENSLFNDRYHSGSKRRKSETICNAVAAEILVPQAYFTDEWRRSIADNTAEKAIEDCARKFSCSTAVIARRAYDNDYIDHDLYKKIMHRAMNIAKDKKSASGGDYYRTMASRIDRRFLSMLANSVQEGKTMYTDAFRLTNTNRTTFNKLLDQTGGSII
ncbi:MAG TPA: ImmA/IrrE family metallo-endopeptidase [Candidatus Ornithomonoglobus merdipullorum]|uniref:ImmA/IrrE family metallo-endopeptidase n=1 Tax=Candidatus Ornithomonoglobus merdipullorum TaxID=2840895 RepID=A0A9D1MBN7_9FIRM|nr:ImmA/IrrE family metallo-endopeptidase [Candidatus Ornithomonoglobus merdipullorum]